MNPRDLPNIDGFEFIGIVNHQERRRCRVVRDPETMTHYVDGEARYCDLTGWEYPEKEGKQPLEDKNQSE